MRLMLAGEYFLNLQILNISFKVYDCCQFLGCPNRRGKDVDVAFFRFPSSTDERLVWIRNSGK